MDDIKQSKEITPVAPVFADEMISCPYCGESIRRNARKCRYCGEWLAEGIVNANSVGGQVVPSERGVPSRAPEVPPQQIVAPTSSPAPASAAAGANNNVIVNVQNIVQQSQEQIVIVEKSGSGSSESAPGWIFGEMWLIAGGIGLAMSSWWWFFGIGIVLPVMLLIPFLGAVVCWGAGLAWGLLAGAICAAIWNEGVAWVVGIVVAIGAIYGHLEARQKNIEEMNENN